ncbi:SDR family oxidoreductase [Octadecabacter ascidiaceicola]|uniref:3-oxoacyl-[acyl-carrier-protein] reductase FabG n=1 Tax=Octadecabacter ascidiaceicola TaxID=1655543 RepID=A0A238KIY4_9RHOB|nr:SDR family oxidoreductase [Octadecabacter ascidiaceicola]SMX42680.1 3-oxoacyl-[acyl-carrier-protein] reductase FabG [Octadecabacter ascidiaceicola]
MPAALITGGGARLGKAMALYLGQRGYDVAVHYNSSAKGAEDVAATCGGKSVALQADLLDEAQIHDLLPEAAQQLGQPVNVLVNNASIFEYDTIETATKDSWDRHMGSNLRAPFVLTQAFAKQAPEAGTDENGESIANALVVNMLDQRVRKMTPEFMTYTLAKMGLWAFTQTAAMGLAPHVRVNAIGPGPTLQGLRQSDAHFEGQRSNTVLKRGANPSDITAALGYFLDAPAVTGQLLCVDGGQHIGWKTQDILGVE